MEKSQIDTDKEKQLQGAEITEFEYNVNKILKLIRDGDMDGTQEELAELVKDIYSQYIWYRDHPEGNNLGLQNQISEFEKKSKEREEELSASKGPKSKTEIEDKVKRILELIKDGNLDMDGTPEEILKREPLAELVKDFKSITYELNVLQNKSQKSDLEVQLVDKSRENSECLIQIQSLKEEVGRKTQEQERLIEERENLTMQLSDLELEMSILKSKDEEQTRANIQEISHLRAFTAQVDNLEKDLLSLQKTKEELEIFCEKLREEHAQTLTIVVNEKNELADKIMDLQRTLKEQEDAYQKLNEEYKQINSRLVECKVELEVKNRKNQEMLGELRKHIATKNQMVNDLKDRVEDLKSYLEEKGNETSTLLDNVRNHEEELRQKLRNTEELLSEKEESFRKVKEELQQVQRKFNERMEAIMKLMKGGRRPDEESER